MTNARDTNNKTNEVASQYEVVMDASLCINLLQKWNAELLGFYGKRFQQYWALPYQFVSCKSADDVIGVQVNFYRQLVDDYREESEKISETVGHKVVKQSAEDLQAHASKVLKAQKDAKEIINHAKAQSERIIIAAKEEATKQKAEAKKDRQIAA